MEKNLKALLVLILMSAFAFGQMPKSIEITAGDHDLYMVPVRVELKNPISTGKQYQLVNEKTKFKIPAQALDSFTLVFIAKEKITRGATATYSLIASKEIKPGSTPVTIKSNDEGLLVTVKGKPVFFYHTKEVMPPPDSPLYYKRSGFIHPLYSPDGKILTDDFPLGHVHQHAIFMTWVNTTFKGEALDFWNQQLQKGTVEHISVEKIQQGPVAAQLELRLRHKSLKYGEVLNEIWKITVYPFADYFLFDFESAQTNTTADTLFLNQYHYGGLAFRGSRSWNPDDKMHFEKSWHILTSENILDTLANHTHASWVDAWGNIEGKIEGASVFCDPGNFRYPQSIRVHPNLPYWAYAPVVDGAFYIAPKAVYRSRYRYFVHSGVATKEELENRFQQFADRPLIKIR
ncbi:MAG: hypothetical protein C5B52_14410 [Bacteroidetes bacterium]|nr:MAG: hypothetical protein C5B52_14410 [Bacteroidota bacterium]